MDLVLYNGATFIGIVSGGQVGLGTVGKWGHFCFLQDIWKGHMGLNNNRRECSAIGNKVEDDNIVLKYL